MHLIGIDFGNQSSRIGTLKGGVVIVMDNEASLRSTQTAVAFGRKKRVMGAEACDGNPVNTITNFKHLIGKSYNDQTKEFLDAHVPTKVVPTADNSEFAFEVEHKGQSVQLLPQQIVGAYFTKLKRIAERDNSVTHCVIAVPHFFTPEQRALVHAAGQIAGLNVTHLYNENVCLGYTYGFYRRDQLPPPDESARLVLFVDVGHSMAQMTLIAFNQGRMEIVAEEHNTAIGGMHFDEVIRQELRARIQKKYSLDPAENRRAWSRLLKGSERAKKMMSTMTTPVPVTLELTDRDVEASIDRATFEQLVLPQIDQLHLMIDRVLNKAGMTLDEMTEIELLGGSTRVPAVRDLFIKRINVEPKTTMNQEESVAHGAMLAAALAHLNVQTVEYEVVNPFETIWSPTNDPRLAEWIGEEAQMVAMDAEEDQRADAKNSLEEYICRQKRAVNSTPEILQELSNADEWIEQVGDDAPASDYSDKLDGLKQLFEADAVDDEKEDQDEGEAA